MEFFIFRGQTGTLILLSAGVIGMNILNQERRFSRIGSNRVRVILNAEGVQATSFA